MDNTYINFGVMLGIWVALSQIADTYINKLGYLEFTSMWAGVATLFLVGFGIAFYRKMKGYK